MAIDPTEAEEIKGRLRLELGGTVKRVRVLPISAADDWIELLQSKVAAAAAGTGDVVALAGTEPVVTATALIELARRTTHEAVDLIVAYDRAGDLGGRDWLLGNALPSEVGNALDLLRSAALPFGLGILAMVDIFRLAASEEAQRRTAEQSSQPSSTNGHSPTGGLPQDHLKPRSRTPSSISSGKRVRSA